MSRRSAPGRRATTAAAALAAVVLTTVPGVATAEEVTAAEEPAAALTIDAPDEQLPDGVVLDAGAPPVATAATTDGPTATLGEATIAALAQPIVLAGRGNGHGIGLSQYGAQGQALAGRSATAIISHYYSGATVASHSVGIDPRIGVAGDETRLRLTVRGGKAAVTVGAQTFTSSAGQAWTVRMLASGACRIMKPDNTTEIDHTPTDDVCIAVDPTAAAARVDVLLLGSNGEYASTGQYGRDAVVEAVRDPVGGTWRLDAVVELPMEQYLYGLAEMPYSWEQAALRAQAIAGRSYAAWRLESVGANPDRGCSCHLYDSQQDQVYKGWERESSQMWDRWRAAVDATAGKVVSAPGQIDTRDGVVQAFYSSSSNGRTESKHELWGGSVYPYLLSVDDDWALDPATNNPHRAWQTEIARATVASRVGLDQLAAVLVTDRSESGAATSVVFSGVDGGDVADVTRTGSWVRSTFGLRSTTFTPASGNLFTDIGASVHADNILWLSLRGITDGCGDGTRFCPDDVVTRGQMAKFLVRAYDLPPGTRTFADTDGHTFEAEIAALARAGVTYGCNRERTRFCPNERISRAQMAAFLARIEGLTGATPTAFVDARGHRHELSIEAIRRDGITRGCDTDGPRFCPDKGVTRAQMATFIRNAVEG